MKLEDVEEEDTLVMHVEYRKVYNNEDYDDKNVDNDKDRTTPTYTQSTC